jgi:hypothetical protein
MLGNVLFNDLFLSLVVLGFDCDYRTRWLFGVEDGIQVKFNR